MDTSGLRVSEVSEGVLIRWVASEGFRVLSADGPDRAPHGGIRAVVRAAVAGVLMQRKHAVTEAEDGVLVLPPEVAPSPQS
ncbi:hypothetical protein QFZ75_000402 [Streptomyces sp. V3I8]|nr:hypothetical protein [Streptomyces sp. V3I8]